MIHVETASNDPFFNFGAEYYFAAERSLPGPVFMLWSTTPTLMVGKYQNVYEEIDLGYARDHGINIVRRLSGGGTIYTDPGGFQYTFIERDGGKTIDFGSFMDPMIAALRMAGVPAEKSGRNDILLSGRKISGNAQYKIGGTTVHHGSLLFSTDIEEMVRASTPPDYKITSKSIKSVRDRVTNISEHPGCDTTADKFRRDLTAAVAAVTGGLDRYALTEDDVSRISALAEEKFRSRDAVFASGCKKFDFEKTCRLPGGSVTVSFTVRDGVIKEASVTGDFFAADGADALGALSGVPFEKKAIKEAIKNSALDIWGADRGALASAVTEGM